MKLLYVHHAERKRTAASLSQQDDITKSGILQAKLLGQAMQSIKVEAIYCGEFKRYTHTANVINKYVKAPIIIESRFNEKEYNSNETFPAFLRRNMDAIDEIVNKYKDQDVNVVCITSGINICAFIAHRLNMSPDKVPEYFAQSVLCSPVIFDY